MIRYLESPTEQDKEFSKAGYKISKDGKMVLQ